MLDLQGSRCVGRGGAVRAGAGGVRGAGWWVFVVVAAQGDDAGAERGAGREYTVVAVAVDARRWDEACEGGERGLLRVRGDVAWATSTSTTQGTYRERQIDSQGAELMVLTRTADGWRIAAIRWSSRPRRR